MFNILLQVLDDGRLTDGQGRTVDFKNTIVVMTSNFGSAQIRELTNQGAEDWEIEAAVREMLKRGPAGLAADEFVKAAGLSPKVADAMQKMALMGAGGAAGGLMRPELLNRIDETVVFRPLGKDSIGRIVEIQLKGCARAARAARMSITLTDAAKKQIAEEGWDPAFGARPLKRAIQQRVENPLATRIPRGRLRRRRQREGGLRGNTFTFKKRVRNSLAD